MQLLPSEEDSSMKKAGYLACCMALAFLITSCSGSGGSGARADSEAEVSLSPFEQRTATFEAAVSRDYDSLRVMTYNVMVGGSGLTGGDNIARIIDIVQSYSPDILGIQEANGWDENDFAIANRIASETGMDYVYCQSQSDFDTVIFSKFTIADSSAHPEVEWCLGRAEVRLPNGGLLQVFNLHIPKDFCSTYYPQVVELTMPYMDDFAVLMGDFNVVNPFEGSTVNSMVGCNELLQEAGWKWLGNENAGFSIDQIWVSFPMHDFDQISYIGRVELLADSKLLAEASDHRPVAADIFIE